MTEKEQQVAEVTWGLVESHERGTFSFATRDSKGRTFYLNGSDESGFYYKNDDGRSTSYLTHEMQAIWIGKCLMAILEGTGNYTFARMQDTTWEWCGLGVGGLAASLWTCLYEAWQHWQESQKPTKRALIEKIEALLNEIAAIIKEKK